MIKQCGICGKDFDAWGTQKYCHPCRQTDAFKKIKYQQMIDCKKRHVKQRVCAKCGKEFETYYNAKHCSIKCSRTGIPSMNDRALNIPQALTVDITLFLTIVRGLTIKQAAREQMLTESVLKAHIDNQKDTSLYARLTLYYTAEKIKRERRKAA